MQRFEHRANAPATRHHTPRKESSDAARSAAVVGPLTPSAVVDLQRTAGNDSVLSLLGVAADGDRDAVQRQPVEAETETQTAEASGQGIDPGIQAELDHLLEIAAEDMATWRHFRVAFERPVPGMRTLRKAEQVLIMLHLGEPPPTVDGRIVTGGVGLQARQPGNQATAAPDRYRDVDPAVTAYLQEHLAPDDIRFLQEMFSFGHFRGQSMDAEALFGIEGSQLWHSYELRTMGELGAKGGTVIVGGASAKLVEIRYRNDQLGLGYRQMVEIATVAGGVGVGKQVGKSLPGELESGGNVAVVENISTFWAPGDFDCPVSIGEIAGEASFTGGPGGAGIEAALGEMITFYGDSTQLPFLIGPNLSTVQGAGKPASAGVFAGVTLEMGLAYPFSGTRPDKGFMRKSVFFATGKASLSGKERRGLDEFIATLEQTSRGMPAVKLRVEVIGHASRRWGGARDPGTAQALNVELSERRADNVMALVRSVLDPTVVASGDYDSRSATPDEAKKSAELSFDAAALGPDEAVDAGDPADDDSFVRRRADIIVWRED